MQLEAVGAVAVGNLRFEVRGQVDDVDGVEGALFGADTASDAETLRDEGDFAGGVDFDAQLSRPHHRTGLFALLTTFLRLALVRIDNCNTVSDCQRCVSCESVRVVGQDAPCQFVRHVAGGLKAAPRVRSTI